MDLDHIKLQYARLERHYVSSLKEKDPISFLDLSHTLRIWVDMKNSIDMIVEERQFLLEFTNYKTTDKVKKFLKARDTLISLSQVK